MVAEMQPQPLGLKISLPQGAQGTMFNLDLPVPGP